MKPSSLLYLVALAVAPAYSFPLDVQQALGQDGPIHYPGFDLDLSAMRLVQTEGMPAVWMSELDKINLKAQGIRYFDVTDVPSPSLFPERLQSPNVIPNAPNATEKVFPILKTLSTQGPKENLAKFSSFRTRYYRSDTGKQSQQWLLSKIQEITDAYAPPSLKDRISIAEFPHNWGQNSLVLRIAGAALEDEIVVISAHQDSTNLWPFLPAPGADDDGSGTVTILEAYRALAAAGFSPQRTVEFHWYSAEEGGLLGSQAVAEDYAARGKNVIAMSQFDMTAWVKRGTREEVGIITDYVDEELTEFNKKLVDTYLDIPYVETKCGYACSDHASWSRNGYKGIFTIESTFENSNKHIHSGADRIDISDEFSFDHMLQFSKLAVGYVVELGGWTD